MLFRYHNPKLFILYVSPSFDKIYIIPFQVEKNDIIDLAEKMSTKNNASIIFNTDCEIHTMIPFIQKQDSFRGRVIFIKMRLSKKI